MNEKYFIIFQNSLKRRWWDLFTCEGFMHVNTLIYDNGILTFINPNLEGVEIKSFPVDNIYSYLKEYCETQNATCCQIVKQDVQPSKITLSTCVGICKRVLGLKYRFAITPKQLYNKIKKNRIIIWDKQ